MDAAGEFDYSDSDTESVTDTWAQRFKCHICDFIPESHLATSLEIQFIETGSYLLNLPDGSLIVRCLFVDCKRWFHLKCVHATYPDEALGEGHLEDLAHNGIHCDLCWE